MRKVIGFIALVGLLIAAGGCFAPNVPPVAVFSWVITGLTVSFDAGPSYDSEGEIEAYQWNFGDGGMGTGETATHTYETNVARSYSVRLNVTDDDGATDTISNLISVEPSSEPEPDPAPDSDISVSITASQAQIDILSYEVEEGPLWGTLTILAKNVSGQAFNWVSMSAYMKDAAGTVVENGFDLQSDVSPGMTFEMSMFIFDEERVQTIEIYEIDTLNW
ncbi:PKD domain-containing protein [Candidatus Bipolaricaulota bacterium]